MYNYCSVAQLIISFFHASKRTKNWSRERFTLPANIGGGIKESTVLIAGLLIDRDNIKILDFQLTENVATK